MKNKISRLLDKHTPEEKLFNGIWICWDKLTPTERVICSYIILCPASWILGWPYVLPLITAGIFIVLKVKGKEIHLKRPNSYIILGIIFHIYMGMSALTRSYSLSPSILINISSTLCFMFILWYIESNSAHARFKTIAWALSVLVLELILFWVVIQLILKAPYFIPSRTIFASFLDKSERFIAGAGSANYLLPYWPEDKLPGGLVRFAFFFPVPESFALIAGSISLISLNLKNRLWKISLFCSGLFLLFLSGTRSNWIALPLVLIIYYIFVVGKRGGIAFLLALTACISFTSLALPSMTDRVFEEYTSINQSTDNLRRDSTKVRSLIYQRTWEAIVSEPENLLIGRGITGETVLPGYKPAVVGSHSFVLGNLLYRQGLVGSFIFLCFWISIGLHLCQTRSKRPSYSLPILLYASITFATMELSLGHYQILFLALLSYRQRENLSSSKNVKDILESYASRYGSF
jgi:O-antigen ligase